MKLFRRRRKRAWSEEARQTEVAFSWRFLGHVEPPSEPNATEGRSLTYYLGPNHYPAGLYLPKGYNLEVRPGDDEGWFVLRARDCLTEQVLTMWALESTPDELGNMAPGAMKGEGEFET